MKQSCLLLLVLLLFASNTVYSQSGDCEKYFRDAASAERGGDYRKAIRLYNGALICAPGRKEEINSKMLSVFDKIEAQKNEAVKARKQFEIERDKARIAETKAQRQAEKADSLSMENFNIALALQTTQSDPTLALRLAEANTRIFRRKPTTFTTYYQILSDTNHVFYERLFRLDRQPLCLALRPDGNMAVAGLQNGQIAVWNAADKTSGIKLIQAGFNRDIRAVAFSPDGSLLAAAGVGRKTQLWKVREDGLLDSLFLINNRPEAINRLAFSPDGTSLAIGFERGLIQIWELFGPREGPVSEFSYNNGLSVLTFSPDGKYLLAGGDDNIGWIWQLSEPAKPFKYLVGHNGDFFSGVFSSDGKYVLSASSDHTLRLWDWLGAEQPIRTWSGHSGNVYGVSFLPGNRYLLSASEDKTVKMWELEGRSDAVHTMYGHRSDVLQVQVNPGGTHFWSIGRDSTIRYWPVSPRQQSLFSRKICDSKISAIQGDAQTKNIFVGNGAGEILVWNPALPGREPVRIPAHSGAITDLALQPGILVSAGRDSMVRLWKVADSCALKASLPRFRDWVHAVAITPDGQILASAASDSTLQIWDLRHPEKPVSKLECKEGFTLSLAFSPDGKKLLAGGEDGLVRLWNCANPANLQLIQVFRGHASQVVKVAFGAGQQTVLSASNDNSVRRWNVRAPLIPQQIMKQYRVMYLANMHCAVNSVTEDVVTAQNNRIQLWDKNGVSKPFWANPGLEIDVSAVAFDPGRGKIVAGFSDGHVEFWSQPDEFVEEFVAKIDLPELVETGLYIPVDEIYASGDPRMLASVAEMLFKKEDFKNSMRFWQKARKMEFTAQIAIGLYKTGMRLGNQDFEQFLNTDEPDILDQLGRFTLASGDYTMARRVYSKMAEADPGNVQRLISLYEACFRENTPFDLNLFYKLKEGNKIDLAIYTLNQRLGYNAYISSEVQLLRLYIDLMDIFDKALEIDSVRFNTRERRWRLATWSTNVAEIYTVRGDFDRALAYLDKSAQYDPGWYAIYQMRPLILIRMNRFDDAMAFYQTKKADPFNPKKGMPTYRDVFLKDLEQLETSGELDLYQLSKMAAIKSQLKTGP